MLLWLSLTHFFSANKIIKNHFSDIFIPSKFYDSRLVMWAIKIFLIDNYHSIVIAFWKFFRLLFFQYRIKLQYIRNTKRSFHLSILLPCNLSYHLSSILRFSLKMSEIQFIDLRLWSSSNSPVQLSSQTLFCRLVAITWSAVAAVE